MHGGVEIFLMGFGSVLRLIYFRTFRISMNHLRYSEKLLCVIVPFLGAQARDQICRSYTRAFLCPPFRAISRGEYGAAYPTRLPKVV
jgi:hypothetical protein